jgi:hypothetical protein
MSNAKRSSNLVLSYSRVTKLSDLSADFLVEVAAMAVAGLPRPLISGFADC